MQRVWCSMEVQLQQCCYRCSVCTVLRVKARWYVLYHHTLASGCSVGRQHRGRRMSMRQAGATIAAVHSSRAAGLQRIIVASAAVSCAQSVWYVWMHGMVRTRKYVGLCNARTAREKKVWLLRYLWIFIVLYFIFQDCLCSSLQMGFVDAEKEHPILKTHAEARQRLLVSSTVWSYCQLSTYQQILEYLRPLLQFVPNILNRQRADVVCWNMDM